MTCRLPALFPQKEHISWKLICQLLWILVFEICLIWLCKILIIIWIYFNLKICSMLWNGFCTKFDNFAIFCFWGMVDFVPNIHSELETNGILNFKWNQFIYLCKLNYFWKKLNLWVPKTLLLDTCGTQMWYDMKF